MTFNERIKLKSLTTFYKNTDERSQWGGLYEPTERKPLEKEGLRTVLFGSTTAGALVLNSLRRFEEKHPHRLNLVGIATDDPVDLLSRISLEKRIWKLYSPEERTTLRDSMIHLSIDAGISCYTGNVKTDYFRQIFNEWNPELIIMCCFGQIIDKQIFTYPDYGMYNFHPSDLAANIGAGPQPFHNTIQNGRKTSVMSVHQVTEQIDQGPVVGQSPAINICRKDGEFPESILGLQEKIPSICGWMTIELVLEAIDRKEKGVHGPISTIDFAPRIPGSIHQKLLEPVSDAIDEQYTLPWHHKA